MLNMNKEKFHNYENESDLKVVRVREPTKSTSSIISSSSTTSINNGYSILKVYLENKAVKSFKYDRNTYVKDVLWCLKEKLAINNIEYFGLVVKPSNDNSMSKFKLLNELQHLHEINDMFLKSGFDSENEEEEEEEKEHEEDSESSDSAENNEKLKKKSASNSVKIRKRGKTVNYVCLFRFVFVPSDFQHLKLNDENAFNYLYEQVNLNFRLMLMVYLF